MLGEGGDPRPTPLYETPVLLQALSDLDVSPFLAFYFDVQ